MTRQKFTADYGRGVGHGDNRQFRTCDECGATDASPYFTTQLKEVRVKAPKRHRNRQPRWYCDKHKPRKVVSPTNGKVYTLKEYERLRGS